MRYTVFIVCCGLLALKVHGLSTPVVPYGSEEQFPVEVDKLVHTLMRARGSEESGCSEEDSTESKGDKCETKNNNEFERPGAEEDQDLNYLKGEFEKSVDKILSGIKLILVDDVPLLYGSPFRCGKRFSFKCQYEYTTSNDTDDWFYGYQTVPGPTMLRVTDAINSFVSNNFVSIFAIKFDQEYWQSPENVTFIDIEEFLRLVHSIVERDPDRVPDKFACGCQVGKQMECSYVGHEDVFGPQLDFNDSVKRIVNSKKFRSAVIKFAKLGSIAFPALRDSLTDKILAILIKP